MKSLTMTPELLNYVIDKNPSEPALLKELRQATDQLKYSWLRSPTEQISFITFFLKMLKPKKILELGTFTGYSTLSMALATPETTQIITCDINQIFPSVGEEYWKRAKVSQRIDLRLGQASETLKLLIEQNHKFDYIFIDADKQRSMEYLHLSLSLLNNNGLIMVDNTLWRGLVAAVNTRDSEALAMNEFNEELKKMPSITYNLLPIGDGLTLIAKV